MVSLCPHDFTQSRTRIEILGWRQLARASLLPLCLWSARDFSAVNRKAAVDRGFLLGRSERGVSRFHPERPSLKGADPEIYETFRIHCLQITGRPKLFFGVSEAPTLRCVPCGASAEFPEIPIHSWGVHKSVSPIPRSVSVQNVCVALTRCVIVMTATPG